MSNSPSSNSDLNAQRRRAVQLRLSGSTLAAVRKEVGLSTPTIVAAVKAFKQGGWAAVDVKPRGRPRLSAADNAAGTNQTRAALLSHLADKPGKLWSSKAIKHWLNQEQQTEVSLQTAANYLQTWQLLPENQFRRLSASTASATDTWLAGEYEDFKALSKRSGTTILWVGIDTVEPGLIQLYAHTLRGRCFWMPFKHAPSRTDYTSFFANLLAEFPKGTALVLPNKNVASAAQTFAEGCDTAVLCKLAPPCASTSNTSSQVSVAKTVSNHSLSNINKKVDSGIIMTQPLPGKGALPLSEAGLTHLQRLEAESIQIMREVAAEADNPVMLYSIGKDSAVMLHLARKAFFPAKPPFPLLHVDTTWKFQEMYQFRDNIVKEQGFELLTHVNPEGVEKGVNPFTHGSALHTDIMKTQGLKQALEKHGFDVAFGGARRDEEKSRAKERVFSFRTSQHRWEPKNQRPELWNLYNTRKQPGESIRVFPISNWTELDIWQYIHLQNIPIVPLYLAAERPVVERDGQLIMVDDDRMPLKDGEVPMMRKVRFRTLGCYPLTGAVESTATTLPEVIQEMLLTKTSERQGRMIDKDTAASMEKKKQEGYF